MAAPFEIPAPVPLHEQQGQTFCRLVAVMQRLLAPDGCPWDREQDMASLRKYVLEEACEVIDAIDAGEPLGLAEELGDLALQVAFISELARAKGWFGPDDVLLCIVEKLVRRHPHVFGEASVEDSDEVLRNWERIKAEEKRGRPLLAGVPRSLPALLRAQSLSERAARVGFDWPDGRGARAKVAEELAELDSAMSRGNQALTQHELGDVLFSLVNLARHLGLDAEACLREAGDRFAARFAHVEERVKERHGGFAPPGEPSQLTLQVLDEYWNEAKAHGIGQEPRS